MQSSFSFLQVPNHPFKHSDKSAGWEIVENFHHTVLTTTKETILTSNFLSLFANEIIAIDNQSWISIRYYLMATWKHMHILFTLE